MLQICNRQCSKQDMLFLEKLRLNVSGENPARQTSHMKMSIQNKKSKRLPMETKDTFQIENANFLLLCKVLSNFDFLKDVESTIGIMYVIKYNKMETVVLHVSVTK